MKTSRRKSLLISSVSMLLVAGVSLGTATFAWFTSSTSTKTSNLQFRTTKSSTLEISKSDGAWTSSGLDYGLSAKKLLLPASSLAGSKDPANWFTANAVSTLDGGALKGTAKALSAGDVSNYVFMEQLNVRNAGDVAVEDVVIKFSLSNATAYDYLRVAVVEASGLNGADKTGVFASSVYANNATAYKPISTVSGAGDTQTITASVDLTPIDAATTVSIPVGDLAPAEKEGDVIKDFDGKYYNLYIWFEGQDPDCKDANAGAEIPNIEFTVEGVTATETETTVAP